MAGPRWLPADDALLGDLLACGCTCRECGVVLGRTRPAVSERKRKLGLAAGERWGERQDAQLSALLDGAAERLGRSPGDVALRMLTLDRMRERSANGPQTR